MKKVSIALAGNPNCGKTTVFNALTGSRQRVGNWPGVTVERVEGSFIEGDTEVKIIDLPGIYSFSAYSLDEKISREYILTETPDLVVNIIDATNLERNLYLTTQLLEMKVPVIVVLNMMDVAKRRKIIIELEHLQRHLDCPVIPVVASRKSGITELKEEIIKMADVHRLSRTHVVYDEEIEEAIELISGHLEKRAEENKVDKRWLAVKLLEQDEIAVAMSDDDLNRIVADETTRIEKHVGEDLDICIADGRYGFIHGLARDVVRRDSEIRKTVSASIDKVILNRVLGVPIFIAVMYSVFVVTINFGGPFIDFFDQLCGTIFVDGFGALLGKMNSPDWLIALLADGLGGGIQTLSTFVPPIFLIFFCLAILEDSGYMARAAFVMDRFLRMIGLPGKAFIPMLVGFGCNVPAILATRTLENNRDRILTILMNPLMSCGARLPVYTLFVAAFFPRHGGSVLFGLYFAGIFIAIMTGMLFKKTILRGEISSFVMELPPYHLPTFRGIMHHTWNRLKSFMLRAGQFVLIAVVVLSFLNSIGTDGSFGHQNADKSVLSAVSKKVAPVFYPMGLTKENWPGAVGLFTGLFAKESVVSTLDTLYTQLEKKRIEESGVAVEEEPLDFWGGIGDAFAAIPEGFEGFLDGMKDPLGTTAAMEDGEDTGDQTASVVVLGKYFDGQVGALAYLLFILIYAPCVAAIGAIYRETNFRWAAFSVCYLTFMGWIISTVFYQLGTFARHPARSAMWLGIAAVLLIAGYVGLKVRSKSMEVAA